MKDELALSIRHLRKNFDKPAVDDLNLDVRAGEFYMLLGPNGAGKTTTLRMVSGLLKPDAGRMRIFGIPTRSPKFGSRQASNRLAIRRTHDL